MILSATQSLSRPPQYCVTHYCAWQLASAPTFLRSNKTGQMFFHWKRLYVNLIFSLQFPLTPTKITIYNKIKIIATIARLWPGQVSSQNPSFLPICCQMTPADWLRAPSMCALNNESENVTKSVGKPQKLAKPPILPSYTFLSYRG